MSSPIISANITVIRNNNVIKKYNISDNVFKQCDISIGNKTFPINSFVKNFAVWLKVLLGPEGIVADTLRKTDGSYHTAYSWSYNLGMYVSPSSGVLYGIVVGTGNTAVTHDDYNLDTIISHGTSGGQLLYGNNSIAVTGGSGADVLYTISRTITNSSGSPINIKETGLIGQTVTSSSNVLLARDLVDYAINNGESVVIKYNISVSEASGFTEVFIKSLRDVSNNTISGDTPQINGDIILSSTSFEPRCKRFMTTTNYSKTGIFWGTDDTAFISSQYRLISEETNMASLTPRPLSAYTSGSTTYMGFVSFAAAINNVDLRELAWYAGSTLAGTYMHYRKAFPTISLLSGDHIVTEIILSVTT